LTPAHLTTAPLEDDLLGTGKDANGTRGGRLVSLDAFRGLTIAAMILVNNPGSWSYVYWPLDHAEWNGWTPTDLIFPYFIFILGVALPFSFARRMKEGASRRALFAHVVRRALIIVGLGVFMRVFPDFHFSGIRWPGVLQRIGVVYLAAAGIYLFAGARARWIWTLSLLFGYWAVMTLVPVPGHAPGDLSPEGNLAAWLDRALMAGHLYRGTWDPEGILSTFPAVATALLGIFTGEWLRSGREGRALTRGMLAAGVVLTVVGLGWGQVFPINKNLWTSSYVVFTAGTALVLLGLMHEAIDVRGWRGRWHVPLVVYGMNAIAVFVLSGLVTKMLTLIHTGGEGGHSLYGWIFVHGFQAWAGDYNGSLMFALCYVLAWLGAMWVLYRKRIFIKI
jgi:predicted acyltransferase